MKITNQQFHEKENRNADLSNQATVSERSRLVKWEDPMIGITAGTKMSGIELLRSILRGEIPPPPIANLMNMKFNEVGEGYTIFSIEPGEYHCNPAGLVHGGVLATLLDSAMALAIYSLLPQGTGNITVDIHITYVRPVTPDTGVLYCKGEALHKGGQIATATGKVYDRNNKLYAHATTTCMLLNNKKDNHTTHQ